VRLFCALRNCQQRWGVVNENILTYVLVLDLWDCLASIEEGDISRKARRMIVSGRSYFESATTRGMRSKSRSGTTLNPFKMLGLIALRIYVPFCRTRDLNFRLLGSMCHYISDHMSQTESRHGVNNTNLKINHTMWCDGCANGWGLVSEGTPDGPLRCLHHCYPEFTMMCLSVWMVSWMTIPCPNHPRLALLP
jgi:hypothetical protein